MVPPIKKRCLPGDDVAVVPVCYRPYELPVLKHLKRELESFRSDQQRETAEQQRQLALAEQQGLEEEGAEAEGGETDREPDADGEIIL